MIKFDDFVKEIKEGDGEKYIGEFVNNEFNGLGLMTYVYGKSMNKKAKYIGEFKNDRKHGMGCYFWDDGTIYFGNHCDGRKHGYGIVVWSDTIQIENPDNDSTIEAKNYPRGQKLYIGEFNMGYREGYGKLVGKDKQYFG